MAFVPALIIPGMSVARIVRHYTSDERDSAPLTASETRKQGVVDRMVAGSTPPVSYWSEKQLEKMIKTNSAFRERGDELRSAHAASNPSRQSGRASTASAPDDTLMGA